MFDERAPWQWECNASLSWLFGRKMGKHWSMFRCPTHILIVVHLSGKHVLKVQWSLCWSL